MHSETILESDACVVAAFAGVGVIKAKKASTLQTMVKSNLLIECLSLK